MHELSLKPDVLSTISGFALTDTLVSTLLADVVIIGLVAAVCRPALVPGRIQNLVESVFEYFYELAEQITGPRVNLIFPWFLSFFLFIAVSNFMGLLPGFSTIWWGDEQLHVPFLRAATSDLNTTLALAAVSVAATHIMGIRCTGIVAYLKRFFSLNPIFMFVGILEIISEATKLVSLSFRLFGNIFAGEVVIATVSSLFAFVGPLPFLMLECIVALVQALVFAMLTMVFMSIMTTAHE